MEQCQGREQSQETWRFFPRNGHDLQRSMDTQCREVYVEEAEVNAVRDVIEAVDEQTGKLVRVTCSRHRDGQRRTSLYVSAANALVSAGSEVQLTNAFGCFSGFEMAKNPCTALSVQFLDTPEVQYKAPFGVSNYS